jgi:hypothetical protein
MAENDLALVLIGEFSAWFEALSGKGILPRAFTGVTRDGKQAVIVLTDLPLDHVQRRAFLIWLCRTEAFVAYAYGTRVGIADDSSSFTEALDIYASFYDYDVSRTLGIEGTQTVEFGCPKLTTLCFPQIRIMDYSLACSGRI